MFGIDVDRMEPGSKVVMVGEAVHGYPFRTLADIPDGDYTIQAVFHRYTLFRRADGRQIQAHMDQWEGQQAQLSPGNLYSEPKQLHVRNGGSIAIELSLTKVIPPIEVPPDTRFVKRLKFKSELLSKFWGHDMEVGATIALPNSYYDNPTREFPVVYFQGHFEESDLFVLPETRPITPPDASPYKIRVTAKAQHAWDLWHAKDAPQLIVVSFQHPTPFYDSSYLVNSPNVGPYGDMVMEELIPRVETSVRIIKQPWARVLTGGSIGGWTAAALQINHPEFFGGVWSACPDPLDFRHFYTVDLYADDNAFTVPGQHWVRTDRLFSHAVDSTPNNTMRRVSQLHLALGSKGRSGELLDNFSASFGPVGADGYPTLIWDHETGRIDHDVVGYWRDHGFDLRGYLETHWPTISSQLVGKLCFFCGEADQHALNQGMYDLQRFLEKAVPAYGGYFYYARPNVGHERVYSREVLLEDMLREIARNAPRGYDLHHLNVPPASLEPLRGN